MIKLLVEAPTGQQEVIEITASGSYFDPARVLWDERTDGPLPEITLGGMVRERVVTVVHHPAEMGDDGRGEYTQISPAWDEEMVSWGPLTFDQAVLDARPVIPAPAIVVPMHKAREALIRSGVSIATINAAINAIPDATKRELARNAWEYSPTVSSQSALVQTLGPALGLDVDALFNYARALP